MINLNPPPILEREYRHDLPDEMSYLTHDGKNAWISAKVRPGGHSNPAFLEWQDKVKLHEKVSQIEVAQLVGKPEEYAKADIKHGEETADFVIGGLFDTCVISWATNIANNGAEMTFDKEHFVALSKVRSAAIADFFAGLAEFVIRVGEFVAKADEDAAKN